MIYLLLVLFVPVLAALLKLAAKLYRRTRLSWTHALVFAVLYDIVALACIVAVVATRSAPPLGLAIPVGLLIQVSLAGWFFGTRAQSTTEEQIGFKGGAILHVIALLLLLGIAVLLGLVGLLVGRVLRA